MPFQKKYLNYFFLLLIVLIIIGVTWGWNKAQYHQGNIHIRFSFTDYPDIRQKIANWVIQDHGTDIVVKASDIGIYAADLNDDAQDEYIALITANGFTSIGGISTAIYALKKGQLNCIWNEGLTFANLVISNRKTNGYHDIWSFANKKYIISWKNKRYQYTSKEHITEYERGAYKNEEL